jgi:hypothetical protein
LKLTEFVEALCARGVEIIDASLPVDPDVVVHVLGTSTRRPIEMVTHDERGNVVLYIAARLEPLDPAAAPAHLFVEDGD